MQPTKTFLSVAMPWVFSQAELAQAFPLNKPGIHGAMQPHGQGESPGPRVPMSQHTVLPLSVAPQRLWLSRVNLSNQPDEDQCDLTHERCLLDVASFRKQLNDCGYAVLNGCVPIESITHLNHWVASIREAHDPGAQHNTPYSGMNLRWQRQHIYESAEKRGHRSWGQWLLVSAKNCDREKIQLLTAVHPIFEIAEAYFSQLDTLLSAAFDGKKFSILEEIRYIDPLDNPPTEDTYWHCDGWPVYLTAACSLLGPGTVFSTNLSATQPSDLDQYCDADNPQSLNNANTESVLVFHGKAGSARPLWHKSPKVSEPRLLLLYRFIKAGEEASIRDIPD